MLSPEVRLSRVCDFGGLCMFIVQQVGFLERRQFNPVSAIYGDERQLQNVVVRVDILDTVTGSVSEYVSSSCDIFGTLTRLQPYGFNIGSEWQDGILFSIIAIGAYDFQFLGYVDSVSVVDGIEVDSDMILKWLMSKNSPRKMQHVVDCRVLDADNSLFRVEFPISKSHTLLSYCCSEYSFWRGDKLYCVAYARWKSGELPKKLRIRAYEVVFEDVEKAKIMLAKHAVLLRK